ncbi:uncharacterized protein BHQ10_003687 [Talaromyces amestolkiae]|uniref:Uncharacterized protein n=1 Tax=Talaromyces amestolkiae TaxID=1196081 RepID=A0A364KVT9_TALAM|nr:uncharacterized protein BHQ10_003687 [Talaromyces amestolkiae]RAO67675.1 hypothetical protein BHQ10_003687 [Talaromyces amestolkiae]
MSNVAHSEGSRTREQWVDDLLEQITPQKAPEDGPSSTSDVESPLNALQHHFDEGQRRIESTYNNLEKSFQQLIELNTAREAEREEDLDFFDALKASLDKLKLHYNKTRTEYLEEVAEKFLKTGQLWFLKEVSSMMDSDILLDCRIVDDIKKRDGLKAHLVGLGFHAVYSLDPAIYRRHIYAAPADIVQTLNFRAEILHHKYYKNVVDQAALRAMKSKCGEIISLWKKHVDSIKEYPDDADEAKAVQLVDYPEEIKAKIAELDEMDASWEKKETAIQSSRAQQHGLLSYYHARYQGEPEAEFYLRDAYVIIATVTVVVWLCVYISK